MDFRFFIIQQPAAARKRSTAGSAKDRRLTLELSELKLISASNIINLRTAHGMTQAELGAKLNYSDKTISKWERGEAIPDACVLVQMAELFGVTVDELLSERNEWTPPKAAEEDAPGRSYSINVIIAIVLVGVFTIALAVFVTLWLMDIIEWRVFLVWLSVEILVYLILDCVFKRGRLLQYILAAFVLSLFVLAYFFLPLKNPWPLFLLAIPAEVIVFLSCNVRRHPGKLGREVRRMIKKAR